MSSEEIEKPVQPPPLPGGSVSVDQANGQSDKLERIMGWGSGHSAWYYINDGVSQGPVDMDLLRAMLSDGRLSSSTKVWNPSMRNWRSALHTGLLVDQGQPKPPALPYEEIDHRWAMVIALTPVLLVPICDQIIGEEWYSLLIWLIINGLLCELDSDRLKRANHEFSQKFTIFGLSLVPLYLYERSNYFETKQTFLIIWAIASLAGENIL